MNKNTGSRKLALKRETLTSMQSEELEGVQGGSTPASVVISLSVRGTVHVAKSSQQCAQGIASAITGSFSVTKLFGQK